jgi:hypothetical protein
MSKNFPMKGIKNTKCDSFVRFLSYLMSQGKRPEHPTDTQQSFCLSASVSFDFYVSPIPSKPKFCIKAFSGILSSSRGLVT